MSKIIFTEGSSADTPATGTLALYAKTTGSLFTKDDTGTETELSSSTPPQDNILINSSMAIAQRGASMSGVADDAYCLDRFYALTQTANVNVSQVAGDGQRYALRITQPNATAQRVGIAQIVEGVNCRHLRGGSVTLSGRAKASVSATLRFAVLEWTGTEDSVTSDVVSDWTSGSYTAGGFFNATTLTVAGVDSEALDGSNWADFSLTATISASLTNAIVIIWSEGTLAQNATLDIEAVQLVKGENAGDFQPRSLGDELTLCQRYYYRWDGTGYSYLPIPPALAANTTTIVVVFSYPKMRTTPTASSTAASTFRLEGSAGTVTPSNLVFDSGTDTTSRLVFTVSGASAGALYILVSNNTTASVIFTAEL